MNSREKFLINITELVESMLDNPAVVRENIARLKALVEEERIEISVSSSVSVGDDYIYFNGNEYSLDDDIFILDSDVEYFSDSFDVNGKFSLAGSGNLTKLPDGITVKSGFNIMDCAELLETPADLTVGGSLKMQGCRADIVIGSGLTVGNHLCLPEGFDTSTIPDDAEVGGSVCVGLDLKGEKLEDIRSRQQDLGM